MRIAAWLFTAAISVTAVAQIRPVRELQLTLIDLEGRKTLAGSVPGSTFAPRVSPDGREVVFDTNEDGNVWIAKLTDLNSRRRLTEGGRNRGPLWSGDGKRILYVTDDNNVEALYWRPADGTGSAEPVTKPVRAPESWSPAKAGFSFITFNNSDYDVWTYDLTEKRATAFAAVSGSAQHSSHFSPDGRWIAFVSEETGRLEVYVRPVQTPAATVRITKNGGGHPLWAPDQKTLYFDDQTRMFSARIVIDAKGGLTAGEPTALPISGFVQGPLRRQYDLMPDGRHFLMLFR